MIKPDSFSPMTSSSAAPRTNSQDRSSTSPLIVLTSSLLISTPLAAQVSDPALTTSDAAWAWNLVIALIVLAATAASAALPLAAARQWQGSWRISAIAPLVILAVWVGFIALSRLGDGEGHRLWPLEIFAWAMLNMIYMVAVMTAKRVFLKHDEKNATSS